MTDVSQCTLELSDGSGPAIDQQRLVNSYLPSLTRREFMAALSAISACAFCAPAFADRSARPASSHKEDWRWLVGRWDVWHRRLKERLAGSNEWEEFAGKSVLWLVMSGLGTIDDNTMELPGGAYRGLTLRAFDPASGKWSIWWVDGRNPTRIDPPVLGGFSGDVGAFFGRDTFKGRPILVRFRWNDIRGPRPWWEQAFSTDEGATWEVNWRNYFTRTAARPAPWPTEANAPKDFDFLVGEWKVRHRRLKKRLANGHDWEEFGGTLSNWPVLGGHGNVGDNVMDFPSGVVRGVSLRTFDPTAKQWSSWWLDTREPSVIGAPLRGSFANGVGTFIGEDTLEGRALKTREQWSQMTPRSARWEQASSADGGQRWETNWISTFARTR